MSIKIILTSMVLYYTVISSSEGKIHLFHEKMSKREQNKEQKKEAIVNAAREIFLDDGFLKANMDKIAKRAKVTKQTVYRYFESKEVLFEASILKQRQESKHPYLDELKNEDTELALKGFAVGFINAHLSEPHLAMIRLLVAEGAKAPEITRAFHAVGPKETKERVREFLEERFHPEDIDHVMDVLFGTLLSMRMGVLVGLHDKPSEDEIADFVEKTVNLLLKILQQPEATAP